jgi:hypothetical protein
VPPQDRSVGSWRGGEQRGAGGRRSGKRMGPGWPQARWSARCCWWWRRGKGQRFQGRTSHRWNRLRRRASRILLATIAGAWHSDGHAVLSPYRNGWFTFWAQPRACAGWHSRSLPDGCSSGPPERQPNRRASFVGLRDSQQGHGFGQVEGWLTQSFLTYTAGEAFFVSAPLTTYETAIGQRKSAAGRLSAVRRGKLRTVRRT